MRRFIPEKFFKARGPQGVASGAPENRPGVYDGLREQVRRPQVRSRVLADMAFAALASGLLAWACLGHAGGLDLYMTTVLPMLGIALILFLVTEAWGSSRSFSVALLLLMLMGMATQVLVTPSDGEAVERMLMHHWIGLVCALLALPVLHRVLTMPRRILTLALTGVIVLLAAVLVLLGSQGAWIRLGGLSLKLTEFIGLLSLLAMGVIFTDAGRSPSARLWSAAGLLALDGAFLLLFNELENLFVLGVVFVVLALVYRCPGKKLALMLICVVLAAVLVLSLCGWCYDICYPVEPDAPAEPLAEHAVVRLGARLYSKIMLRLKLILDPGSLDVRYEGYQYQKVQTSLLLTEWFGSAVDVNVPAMTTDYIFCGLLLKLGMVAGAAVLMMLLCVLFAGIKGSVGCADSAEGAVAMAFLFAFQVRALLAAAVATNLFPPASISFPFLAEGGSAMLANYVMMLFVIRAIRAKTSRMAEEPALCGKE